MLQQTQQKGDTTMQKNFMLLTIEDVQTNRERERGRGEKRSLGHYSRHDTHMCGQDPMARSFLCTLCTLVDHCDQVNKTAVRNCMAAALNSLPAHFTFYL